MTATVERIRQEASLLPFDEREALVRVLELDLDAAPASQDDPAKVEAEWDAVIKTRVEEIESGTARLIPLDEVEAEMDVCGITWQGMMPVVFHEDAREEYREAIRYYFEIDPDLQAGFRSEVRQHLRLIADNPELFSVRRYGVRRANLDRFGLYYIAYILWKGQVVIVAIGHAGKRPYYWRRRPKHYRDTH